MNKITPLTILLLLTPAAGSADEAQQLTAQQQELDRETRLLQARNAENRARLERLEQAIAKQRELNRQLDEKLRSQSPRLEPPAPAD